MTTRQSQLGLGLGLPHTGSRASYEHSGTECDSADPYDERNVLGRITRDGKPLSCSVDASTRSIRDSHMMHVAATVVGIIPNENHSDRAPEPQGRSGSDDMMQTLRDKEPQGDSVALLKLTRCRVRSEPVSSISGKEGRSGASASIPRADSLLHLDSETVSTDLKKLLNARVRQAPPSIDTGKANASRISSAASSPTKDGPRSSRLETEKSRPRLEVYFGLNNHVAVEGGRIGGSLTVRTRKPRRGEARHVRIDSGKIRVLGYEGISESERYAFYQCATSLADAAGDHEQLYESLPDSEGFRVVREGTFTLTFKMHIPQPAISPPGKNVPKGVIQDDSINAAIKYIILISFKVRDDPDNAAGLDKHASLANPKTSIAHFYRHVEIWPTYGPLALHSTEARPVVDHSGTVSSRAARELFFGGSGMLHLTAVLHRKVWLAGQKCTVYIGAWNETRKFVKTLTVAIIRKATIARPNQNESITRKQIAEVTLDAVRGPTFGTVTGKGWWAGIEPGSSCELSHMIDIPIDALTVPRTHVIEISYVLRVSLITGSLSPNVSVDLPFVVINALSTDGLPVPPPPGLLTGSLKLPKATPVLFSFKPPLARDNKNLDLRTWSFPHASPQETCLLPRDYILDWTKQTSTHEPHHADLSPITRGSDSLPVRSRGSPRLDDTSTTLESVSDFITQLESDLDSIGHAVSADQGHRSVRFAHQSNERGLGISSILKAPSSAKHRVTFVTPTQSDTFDVYSTSQEPTGDTLPHHSDIGHDTGLLQQPPVKKLKLRDDGPALVIPDKDIWSSDDADAILGSINIDSQEGFNTYGPDGLDYSQEIIVDRPPPGVYTASTLSSEPWSSEATTTDYQSSTDQHSSRLEAPSPDEGRPPTLIRRREISSAPGSQYSHGQRSESFFAEDTPRAGSIRRFQPGIVTGTVQTSASRATLVPVISSPMLAKSQSAHVIGSPVNQYRRFVHQSSGMPSREVGSAVTHDGPQMSLKEKRKMNAGRTPWKTQWDQTATSIPRESARVGPQSPEYIDRDIRTSRIHLRTRSTPQSREEQSSDPASSNNTVRSRIAALEERSRERPYSSHC